MDTPTEKLCSKCHNIKPIEAFHKDPSAWDGRRPWCRKCHNADLHTRKFRLPPNCICEYCHIPFYEPPARKAKDRGRFCSRKHKKAFFAEQTASEKVCKTCGISKPLEAFLKHPHSLYGREAHCRTCTSKSLSLELLIDGVLYEPMLMKQWRALLLEHGFKYCPYHNHICHIDDFSVVPSALDKHAGWCNGCRREIYIRDQDKILASCKRKYQKNAPQERTKARTKYKRYRIERPELLRAQGQRSNARRRALLSQTILVEDIELEVLAERDNWLCHICGKKVTRNTWSADHLIPVSAKGETSYLNVALAHKSCNSSRGPGRIPAQLRLFGLLTSAR